MSNNKIITTKKIYPQIYAYVTPYNIEKDGWVKIGYTERKDVNVRINEQTHTPGVSYVRLWNGAAKYVNSGKWFTDREYHYYLENYKHIKREKNEEWFYYGDNDITERSHNDFNDFINGKNFEPTKTTPYKLRDEQQDAVDSTFDYFNNKKNEDKLEFLWNAKPRFGKTLSTYDLVKKMNLSKVLIVTNRPSVGTSWLDDFKKFIYANTDYAFVSNNDALVKDSVVLSRDGFLNQLENGRKRLITFLSLQDLKGAKAFGGDFYKLEWVKDLDWDLLVVDESHEGTDTDKSNTVFSNISRKYTLYLSGTPFKDLENGSFEENQIYSWTYADEQDAKQQWENNKEKYGLYNPYKHLPKMHLFTYQMSKMITKKVNKGIQIDGSNMDYTFNLNDFFKVDSKRKFIHEDDIKEWLWTLTNNENYPFSTHELRDELKHTLWMLNSIDSVKALKKLLEVNPVFENYKIVAVVGQPRGKKSNFERVQDAIKNNEKTITLSVRQLTTGITIPEWTGVLMLSNMESVSQYIQTSFRAQNPWTYYENGNLHYKKNAYIFDFSPTRTLNIYSEYANALYDNDKNHVDAKRQVKKLLNFFPVIGEDEEGKMIELDSNKILSLPKVIKSNQVVREGFRSNLLFRNISHVFKSDDELNELNEIIDNLKNKGKKNNNKRHKNNSKSNNVRKKSRNQYQLNKAKEAHFGEKFYSDLDDKIYNVVDIDNNFYADVNNLFKNSYKAKIHDFAKSKNVNVTVADESLNNKVTDVKVKLKSVEEKIKNNKEKLETEYDTQVSYLNNFADEKIRKAQEKYNKAKQALNNKLRNDVISTVHEMGNALVDESFTAILNDKQEEEEHKNKEKEIRETLRGFTRTIPLFLMAYGDETTTLKTLDKNINPQAFKEKTGITIEQFRELRDKYDVFDEVVFDESIKIFLETKRKLANYFDENQTKDIFDYIPQQEENKVFTPKEYVRKMVHQLEIEDPEVFKDPKKTFADLYMKSGLYIAEIVKKLNVGLKDKIPDRNERIKHILEHQVYGFAPNDIIYHVAKNFILGFDEETNSIDDSHIVLLDTLPYAEGKGDFDKKCDELFGGDK